MSSSTQSKATTPAAELSEDLNAIMAALKLLGLETRVASYKNITELWAFAQDDFGDEGGFKFTFTNGALTGLHARCAPDYDHWWDVAESPSWLRASEPVSKPYAKRSESVPKSWVN
jgi:hypothetical protein